MQIHASVQAYKERLRNIRRDLHRIPERGFEEFKTHAYIMGHLQKCAPDTLIELCGTGVKAVFYCKHPARTVAFRADIDALPMNEAVESEYSSTHENMMHACGHDAHTSVLLCLAQYIHENREALTDNVVLIFQPGEEHIGGAKRMVDAGCLRDPQVDCIFGLHVWPEIRLGKIGLREGPLMAQTSEIDINIYGKGAHGASPHKGIDAIVVASEFIQLVQTIITRSIDPYKKALITIGKIDGGLGRNILADRVLMEGTIRTFDDADCDLIENRILELLHGLEIGCGVKTDYTRVMKYPSVVNPLQLTEYLAGIMNYEDIVIVDEVMAAEDFSFYQKEVPGLFFFLGIKDSAEGHAPLHNSAFDLNEEALLGGLEIYRRILGIND